MIQSIDVFEDLPPGLSTIAGGRDLIKTNELAQALNIAPQTVRKIYCLKGEVYGIKPIKIGNRLLWCVYQIAKRMRGEL